MAKGASEGSQLGASMGLSGKGIGYQGGEEGRGVVVPVCVCVCIRCVYAIHLPLRNA